MIFSTLEDCIALGNLIIFTNKTVQENIIKTTVIVLQKKRSVIPVKYPSDNSTITP